MLFFYMFYFCKSLDFTFEKKGTGGRKACTEDIAEQGFERHGCDCEFLGKEHSRKRGKCGKTLKQKKLGAFEETSRESV